MLSRALRNLIVATGSVLPLVSLTLGGCSGASVSNLPKLTTPPTISQSKPVSSRQFSQTDLAFLAEIEAYARNNGATFTDVTPAQNVETAHTICAAVQKNGASSAIQVFFNAILSENTNLTEGEGSAIGYMFATSVKYYCPQYLDDVRNFLVSQGALN